MAHTPDGARGLGSQGGRAGKLYSLTGKKKYMTNYFQLEAKTVNASMTFSKKEKQ